MTRRTWAELIERELDFRPDALKDSTSSEWRRSVLDLMETFSRDDVVGDVSWSDVCQRHYQLHDIVDRVGISEDGELLRAYWQTIEVVLKAYETDRTRSGISNERHRSHGGHLPLHVIGCMRSVFGYLAVGSSPVGHERPGRRTLSPHERQTIGLAVAYRMACRKEGLPHNGLYLLRVQDPAPIKTLEAWFKVSRRSIQEWLGAVPPNVPTVGDISAEHFSDCVRRAGQSYQAIGRGLQQINDRQRKRQG